MEEEIQKKGKIQKDKHTRVDTGFFNWVDKVATERMKRLIDTNKISSRKITSMIPKHKSADKMQEDIINHQFD